MREGGRKGERERSIPRLTTIIALMKGLTEGGGKRRREGKRERQ